MQNLSYEEEQERKKEQLKPLIAQQKDKLKEETEFPYIVAGFIVVYSFLAGIFYNYIKAP